MIYALLERENSYWRHGASWTGGLQEGY